MPNPKQGPGVILTVRKRWEKRGGLRVLSSGRTLVQALGFYLRSMALLFREATFGNGTLITPPAVASFPIFPSGVEVFRDGAGNQPLPAIAAGLAGRCQRAPAPRGRSRSPRCRRAQRRCTRARVTPRPRLPERTAPAGTQRAHAPPHRASSGPRPAHLRRHLTV